MDINKISCSLTYNLHINLPNMGLLSLYNDVSPKMTYLSFLNGTTPKLVSGNDLENLIYPLTTISTYFISIILNMSFIHVVYLYTLDLSKEEECNM